MSTLRARFGAATRGANPAQLKRASDEFTALMSAGDTEALDLYESIQADCIGVDPFADGAEEWPHGLDQRHGEPITVPADQPLYGWRLWHLDGHRLVAPFLAEKWGLPRKAPGVQWKPGTNTSIPLHCRSRRPKDAVPSRHPASWCRCGIRVVQSLTVLRAFAANTAPTIGRPEVIARVAFWGQVAPWAPDDDWRYTARAEHVAIAGDLILPPSREHLRDQLTRRYRIGAGQ